MGHLCSKLAQAMSSPTWASQHPSPHCPDSSTTLSQERHQGIPKVGSCGAGCTDLPCQLKSDSRPDIRPVKPAPCSIVRAVWPSPPNISAEPHRSSSPSATAANECKLIPLTLFDHASARRIASALNSNWHRVQAIYMQSVFAWTWPCKASLLQQQGDEPHR